MFLKQFFFFGCGADSVCGMYKKCTQNFGHNLKGKRSLDRTKYIQEVNMGFLVNKAC
jgi:hypothetical protein